MSKLAVIYARVSSLKQKEGETIESQVSALLKFAEENDYSIPDGWIFKDAGYSGALIQRPALDEMREIVYQGEVNAVLVYSPDRLSRKYVYQLLLEQEFQKTGTDLIFFNTPQAKTPEDKLSLHFKGIFAEYERAQIAERCRRGRNHRAKQGSVSVIATAPYGYIYRKKNLLEAAEYVIDDTKARIVKKIFSQYALEQKSIQRIALELDEQCVKPPRSGEKWHNSTIRDILRNPAYIGTAYFGKSEQSNGFSEKIIHTKNGKKKCPPKSRKARDKEAWTLIPVPAIITEREFELAQRQLDKNKEMSSRNTRNPSLLQGLLVCAMCGYPYYKKSRSSSPREYDCYSCSTRLTGGSCKNRSFKLKELDDAIWNHVIDLLKNPHLIKDEIDNRIQECVEKKQIQTKRKDIEKEILRLNKAKDKLLDIYQDGECITLEDLRIRMKAIEKQRQIHENELKSIQAHVLQEENGIAFKLSTEYFLRSLEQSEELSIQDRQKVIRLLIDEIKLSKDSIEVAHCIPVSAQSLFFSEKGLLKPDGSAASSKL